jgi:hypothetical protein
MEHDHLVAMLNRLKLTAIRDQLDSLIDEAARRELTIREALSCSARSNRHPGRPQSGMPGRHCARGLRLGRTTAKFVCHIPL